MQLIMDALWIYLFLKLKERLLHNVLSQISAQNIANKVLLVKKENGERKRWIFNSKSNSESDKVKRIAKITMVLSDVSKAMSRRGKNYDAFMD